MVINTAAVSVCPVVGKGAVGHCKRACMVVNATAIVVSTTGGSLVIGEDAVCHRDRAQIVVDAGTTPVIAIHHRNVINVEDDRCVDNENLHGVLAADGNGIGPAVDGHTLDNCQRTGEVDGVIAVKSDRAARTQVRDGLAQRTGAGVQVVADRDGGGTGKARRGLGWVDAQA